MIFVIATVFTVSLTETLQLADAATITVPGDHATIQAAINAADSGDIISIAAGNYNEAITINDPITITGAGVSTVLTQPWILNADATITNLKSSGFDGNAFTITTDDTFVFDTITIENVGGNGIITKDDGSIHNSDITIKNSNFKNNGLLSSSNPADLEIFRFEGTILIEDVTITKAVQNIFEDKTTDGNQDGKDDHNDNTYGIEFRGNTCSGANQNPVSAITSATLNNVKVSGTPNKEGILIQCYSDVSNFSFTDVDLSEVTTDLNSFWPTALVVSHTGNDPLDVGNLKTQEIIAANAGGINAKQTQFFDAAISPITDNFEIEDVVGHALDLDGIGLVTWNADNLYVTENNLGIAQAISVSSSGDTINVASGSYTLGTTPIDKNLKLIGAGKGSDDTTNTILTLTGRVTLESGGPSDSDRFTLQSMRVTGEQSVAFWVESNDFFLFDDLTLIDIDGTPFLIWDNNSNPPAPTDSDVIISNSDFENNGCENFGHPSDVKFFEFTGTAIVDNVNMIKASCDVDGENDNTFGLEFRGLGCDTGSDTVLTTDSAITSALLRDLTISGTPNKHALLIQCYDDLSNVTMQNVDLSGTTTDVNAIYPTTFLIGHTGTDSFNLGNTKLNEIMITQTGNVDATNADFLTTNNFDIEDRVTHAMDSFSFNTVPSEPTQGLDSPFHLLDSKDAGIIEWKKDNLYVTEDSGSIQRGIDNIVSGGAIRVHEGLYEIDDTILIDKPLTLLGPQADVDPRTAASLRTAGDSSEAIIDGKDAITNIIKISADDVTINGFEIKEGTGDLVAASTSTIQQNPKVIYNLIHDSTGDEGIQLKQTESAIIKLNHVFDVEGDGINLAFSHNGLIDSNEVHDSNSPDAGIYLYNDAKLSGTPAAFTDFIDATIQNNLVYDITQNDGIKLGDKGGSDEEIKGGSILNNIVHDTKQDGITVYSSNVIVEGNEIFKSKSDNGAIYVGFSPDDITIKNNIIRDNKNPPGPEITYGISIGNTGTDVATNVKIIDNQISKNESGIFYNFQTGGVNLDATNNYWGSHKGPTHPSNGNGNGNGDEIVGDNILFVPWFIDSGLAILNTEPLPAEKTLVFPENDIQLIINNADVGDILEFVAGTYETGAISIDKSITLLSDTGDYRDTKTILTGHSEFQLVGDDADNITIKGFKFEDITGQVFQAVIHSNPDPVAGTGSILSHDNILIEKNSFDTTEKHAIKTNARNDNFIINDNYATNIGNGAGTWTAFQIFFLHNGKVTNNIIDGATHGGMTIGRGTPLDTVFNSEISGNTVSNVPSSGIDIAAPGNAASVVSDNTVTNTNTDSTPDKAGISIWPDSNDVTISGNTITGNFNGVTVRDISGSISSDVIVINNKIHNNAGFAAKNFATSGTLDALNNYWGGNKGPIHTTNGDGNGDEIDGSNITFLPFYINAGLSALSTEVSTTPGEGNTIKPTSKKVTFDDGDDNNDIKGRAALPENVVAIELQNDAVLDVNDNIEEKVDDDIEIGGVTVDLTTFEIQSDDDDSTTDNVAIDLTATQTVANVDVVVEKAVQLESGTDAEPIILTNVDLPTVVVSIPDETIILASSEWTGTIQPPTTGSSSGAAPSGFSVGGNVIEVGSPDAVLLFDTPVTITLEGVTGDVGYKPAGSSTWTQITEVCGGTFENPDAPSAFPGECFIQSSSSTKISTYHFTSFGGLGGISTGGGGDKSKPVLQSNSLSSPDSNIYAGTLKLDDSARNSASIFEIGDTVDLELSFYDNSGTESLVHVTLFTNIRDFDDRYDSKLYVEWNKDKPLKVYDSDGYLDDTTNVSFVDDDSNVVMTFHLNFIKPMDTSHIVLNYWDYQRNSGLVTFADAIVIVESVEGVIAEFQDDENKMDPEPTCGNGTIEINGKCMVSDPEPTCGNGTIEINGKCMVSDPEAPIADSSVTDTEASIAASIVKDNPCGDGLKKFKGDCVPIDGTVSSSMVENTPKDDTTQSPKLDTKSTTPTAPAKNAVTCGEGSELKNGQCVAVFAPTKSETKTNDCDSLCWFFSLFDFW